MPDIEGLEWVTEEQEQQLAAWYGDEWAKNAELFMDNFADSEWREQADDDKANVLDQILADFQQQNESNEVEGQDQWAEQGYQGENWQEQTPAAPPLPDGKGYEQVDWQEQTPAAPPLPDGKDLPPPPADLPPPPPPWPQDDVQGQPEDQPPPPPPWPQDDEQEQQQSEQEQEQQVGYGQEQPGGDQQGANVAQGGDNQQQAPSQQVREIHMAMRVHCGDGIVSGGAENVPDFVGYIQSLGGPDLSGDIDAIVARAVGGERAASVHVFDWGGSQLGLQADVREDLGGAVIVTLNGAFVPKDMQAENDDRLHRLKKDGQHCQYAQCDQVVLLGPGDGDPRYAVLRYACMVKTGSAAGDTEGTITRRDHRMRRDSLDVTPIHDSYKAPFKAAMKAISDKSVDWV